MKCLRPTIGFIQDLNLHDRNTWWTVYVPKGTVSAYIKAWGYPTFKFVEVLE